MEANRRPSDGELIAVTGASRSGKTAWTRQAVRAAPRLLVWDVKGEWAAWPELVRVESWSALAAVIRRGPGEYETAPGRYAFVPPRADRETFDWFAGMAFWWGCAAPAVIVAEELPDVTGQGKAETAWGAMLRRGLGAGVTIYALTQSPAESDKTTLRNAGRVHTGRLGFDRDEEYLARLLKCDLVHVQALTPLDFLERDAAGRVTRGRLKFNAHGRAYVTRPAVIRDPELNADPPTRARARA